MHKKLSRREILKMAALAGIGGAVACAQSVSKVVEAQTATPWPFKNFLPFITKNSPEPSPTATATKTTIPTATPLKTPSPTVIPTAGTPSPLGARVTHVHANNVTSWSGGSSYWTTVSQSVTDTMVETGLKDLTGTSDLTQAWRALIPNYQAGQKIAIKVNFNNSDNCDASSAIDAIVEPVNALIDSLVRDLPVNADDIWVFDAIRHIPTRFGDNLSKAVRLYNKSDCNYRTAGWGEFINFYPPSGSVVQEQLTDVITSANYLINMPIMKRHNCAGVTLGFKNHFGSINDPGGLHSRIFMPDSGCGNAGPLSTTYNPLIDIYRNAHIRYKTVLTVGDGIFGCIAGENQPPSVWSTFNYQPPKSLFFSRDPVAIDSVMADYLLAEVDELGSYINSNATSYLPLAEAAGLGVYEHRNPWNQQYSKITYNRINI